MDVFHKVLLKVFEISGGRENADVDLTDLLKREGFYPSIESISEHLNSEGWVTRTEREYVVRITHWGVSEAKRTLSDTPDTNAIVQKDASRLLSASRELVIMIEEFSSEPSAAKFKVVEKRFADLNVIVSKIAGNY
ncbi:MAG TPA: hypothetical protein VK468_03570 [Pyrinomonadaceae bacterium]|nr:hypothetical protein [Pyrinomonadaceae bacterium]